MLVCQRFSLGPAAELVARLGLDLLRIKGKELLVRAWQEAHRGKRRDQWEVVELIGVVSVVVTSSLRMKFVFGSIHNVRTLSGRSILTSVQSTSPSASEPVMAAEPTRLSDGAVAIDNGIAQIS